MQIGFWTWKLEDEKIPRWWFQCLSEIRVKVMNRDESIGRGGWELCGERNRNKIVDSDSEHAIYKTNPVELSIRFEYLLRVLYNLLKGKPICLAAFVSSCSVHLYISTELVVGWLSHQTGILPGKKMTEREGRRLRGVQGIIVVISHGLWVAQERKWKQECVGGC